LNFGYGEVDRTSHREAFTQELETDHTYYTTREVREEFSQKHGVDNTKENLDEVREEEKNGCNHKLVLQNIDGKDNTTTVDHLLSPDVVQKNVQLLIDEFPDSNYVRNNALQVYLAVVREHGEHSNICDKNTIMNEAVSKLEDNIGNEENEGDRTANEPDYDEPEMSHRH